MKIIDKELDSLVAYSQAGKARVFEACMRRFDSYYRDQIETSFRIVTANQIHLAVSFDVLT